MIISAPTALYDSELPKSDTDPVSVTFLISSTDPPRTSGYLQTIIKSEELKPLPDKLYTLQQREAAVSELIFTVTSPSQKQSGTAAKAFDIGEILEFTTSDITENLDTLSVPEQIDLQHNTNVLDYQAMGLNESEIEELQSHAGSDFNQKLEEINYLVTQVNDIAILIQNNQKSINEVAKAIEATTILISTSGSVGGFDEILQKLAAKQKELIATRSVLISQSNQYSSQSKVVYDEILKLKEVIP